MQKLAQIDFEALQGSSNPKLEFETLGDVVSNLVPTIFLLAGIALLLYLIAGGLQLMTSRGDPKAVEAAKGKITNGLVGIVIIFASFWIIQILGQILGIEALTNLFG